jgi:FtsP/CotA-like multicopper oxidase with cupredoxin domain
MFRGRRGFHEAAVVSLCLRIGGFQWKKETNDIRSTRLIKDCKVAGIAVLGDLSFISRAAAQITPAIRAEPEAKADYTIRIGTGLVELAPDRIISTTTYNGQFPGPLIRLKEGRRVVVDIHNDTDTLEQRHWHGQMVPVDVDGAFEEGTPFIPAHGMRRIAFVPKPTGFRFYHSHVVPRDDLSKGTYGGTGLHRAQERTRQL